MDTEIHHHPLEQIPANRRLVEVLYAHGKISGEAREYALNLLHPHRQWGLWISRLLLIIGTTLVLSGIVYFFAFNWAKITPFEKLYSIQFAIAACIIAVWHYSLQRLSGQVLLLCASVLVGVFMAVFGQIYQTGADAYLLFMMWSLFIFGWTFISCFSAQWILWLVVTNIFLVLWWVQAALPTREMEFLIFIYMTLLNAAALALREHFAHRNHEWLQVQWTRVLLIVATLTIMMIPVLFWIVEPREATKSIILSSCLGLVGHVTAFIIYRHKLPDMWALASTVLSACIMLETSVFKAIWEINHRSESFMFLMTGLITLGIFTAAIIYLRKVAGLMETADV